MAIKNLTDKGLGLPQIGRIKKGEMQPTQKTKHLPKDKQVMKPVDLDYFKVEFADSPEGEKLAAKFYKKYGAEPKSIDIRLPFNEIEEMWDGFLEAYTASRRIAQSDGKPEDGGIVLYRCDGKTGETIVSNGINLKTGKVEPHPADNIAGYDYKNQPIEYTPIGRLRVIIPELREAGYMLLVTGSWNDIRFISQQLAGLKELNNGIIRGVPLKLIRSDHEVMAPIKGKKTRVTKSLISIKADPEWVDARLADDMAQAYPELMEAAKAALLEPGDMVEETDALTELTHPDQWDTTVPPEIPAEAPEIAPGAESTRDPHPPETLKKNIQETILKYDALLEQDPAKYEVQKEHDSKVIASVINEYIGGLQKASAPRYAIFTYLLGEGKASTKDWTAQEVGTIKNIWLKIGTFGDKLGKVEEEELRQLWNFVQVGQWQKNLFE